MQPWITSTITGMVLCGLGAFAGKKKRQQRFTIYMIYGLAG